MDRVEPAGTLGGRAGPANQMITPAQSEPLEPITGPEPPRGGTMLKRTLRMVEEAWKAGTACCG